MWLMSPNIISFYIDYKTVKLYMVDIRLGWLTEG